MENWHDEYEKARSLGDQFADFITDFIGSWWSVGIHTIIFGWWFLHNLDVGLLTNVVSLEAIYLCIYLQMSSNAHGERDRAKAEHDYQTNRKTLAIMRKLATHFDVRLDEIEQELEL